MRQLFKFGYKTFLIFLNLGVGLGVGIYLLMRFRARLTKKNQKQIDMLNAKRKINFSDNTDKDLHVVNTETKVIDKSSDKPKVVAKQKITKVPNNNGNQNRLDEVFTVIKKYKEIDMNKLLSEIKGVTERTLRRDLQKLQNMKLILKEGTTKSAKYKHIVR